jgi:formylmethanofuran--tetrahydromethanopterin N-formyltransferase
VKIGSTVIDDTFAEAFPMKYTRLMVTAHDQHWLQAAVREFCGYAASVIACDAEVGVDSWLSEEQTPDRRRGVALLVFGVSSDALAQATTNRTGQCLMTCPTTAVFNGLRDADKRLPLGRHLRFFGDGYQKSKVLEGVRYWRVPVMDGEFIVEESLGYAEGVAGGNFILQSGEMTAALEAARRAVEAIAAVQGVITPFPGGVARSGSKVGSRYKQLPASTADPFCPTLRGRVESRLHPDADVAYEIVIDGVNEAAVAEAMTVGIRAAAGDQIVAISAGNYGGKLGKFQFQLHKLLG